MAVPTARRSCRTSAEGRASPGGEAGRPPGAMLSVGPVMATKSSRTLPGLQFRHTLSAYPGEGGSRSRGCCRLALAIPKSTNVNETAERWRGTIHYTMRF
jgi:hypothetical protein